METGAAPAKSSPHRLRWLAVLVLATSATAMAAAVLLQHQEHRARDRERTARVYAVSIAQSVTDLVPVGFALSEREPELLARITKNAIDRSLADLPPIRAIDPVRADELGRLVTSIRDVGVARTPLQQQRSFADVTRAAQLAEEIADHQAELAEAAERRAIYGTAGALLFAILSVFGIASRERRRSLADAAAHTAAIRHLADHDSLTGLPNRRRFDNDLDALDTAGGPIEIAVCDLNDFKDINDRLGHDAGDTVLITVSHDLRAAVGDAGTVYRTGGDEFCVVSAPGARVGDLARQAFERAGSTTMGSVGAASLPTDHPLARDVVRLADRRMYAAKQAMAAGGAGRRSTDVPGADTSPTGRAG